MGIYIFTVSSYAFPLASYSTRRQRFVNTSFTSVALYDIANHSFGTSQGLSVSYEMRWKSFIFSIGGGLGYFYKNYLLSDFIDSYDRFDKDKVVSPYDYISQVNYRYVYDNFREKQHVIVFYVPVQIGWNFDRMYAKLGMEFGIPFIHRYTTNVKLSTEGEYDNLIEPIIGVDIPQYGYYSSDKFCYSGSNRQMTYIITPGLEIGKEFSISKRLMLRVAGYAGYSLFFSSDNIQNRYLLDYSSVDISPLSQTKVDLFDNLKINSVTVSRYNLSTNIRPGKKVIDRLIQNVHIGVRFTFSFRIEQRMPCHCL